jgi:hypothetical protein
MQEQLSLPRRLAETALKQIDIRSSGSRNGLPFNSPDVMTGILDNWDPNVVPIKPRLGITALFRGSGQQCRVALIGLFPLINDTLDPYDRNKCHIAGVVETGVDTYPIVAFMNSDGITRLGLFGPSVSGIIESGAGLFTIETLFGPLLVGENSVRFPADKSHEELVFQEQKVIHCSEGFKLHNNELLQSEHNQRLSTALSEKTLGIGNAFREFALHQVIPRIIHHDGTGQGRYRRDGWY